MKKLTDEELSLVLSEQAAGKLTHLTYREGDRGCVAGVVFDLEDQLLPRHEMRSMEAMQVSNALGIALGAPVIWAEHDYPDDPEAMLDLLARAGL